MARARARRRETTPPPSAAGRPTAPPSPEPQELGRLAEMALCLALETASDLASLGRVPDLKIAHTRMQLASGAIQAIEAWIRSERRRTVKAA